MAELSESDLMHGTVPGAAGTTAAPVAGTKSLEERFYDLFDFGAHTAINVAAAQATAIPTPAAPAPIVPALTGQNATRVLMIAAAIGLGYLVLKRRKII